MKHAIKRWVAVAAGIIALSTFAALLFPTLAVGAAAPSAQALLQRASQVATAENKNILVHFDSSW